MGAYKIRSIYILWIFLINNYQNVFGQTAVCIHEDFEGGFGIFDDLCIAQLSTRSFQIEEYSDIFLPPSDTSKYHLVSLPGPWITCLSNRDAIRVEAGTQIMIKYYASKMSADIFFYSVSIFDVNSEMDIDSFEDFFTQSTPWTNFTYTMERNADIKIIIGVASINDFVAIDFISVSSVDCDSITTESTTTESSTTDSTTDSTTIDSTMTDSTITEPTTTESTTTESTTTDSTTTDSTITEPTTTESTTTESTTTELGQTTVCIHEDFEDGFGIFDDLCASPFPTHHFKIDEYSDTFLPPSDGSKFHIVSLPGPWITCLSNRDAIRVTTGTQITIKYYASKMSQDRFIYSVSIYDINTNSDIDVIDGSFSQSISWTNFTYTMERNADIKIIIGAASNSDFVAIDFISISSVDCDSITIQSTTPVSTTTESSTTESTTTESTTTESTTTESTTTETPPEESESWEPWLIAVVTLSCIGAVGIIGGTVYYFYSKSLTTKSIAEPI